MFERYTEPARRVLFFARYEATQFGSLSIDTEHLLLGLVREGKGLTSQLFADARLSPEDLRADVERRMTRRGHISTSIEIPFSAELKRALQFAAEEADRLLHGYIGTEHLLLGLLRVERSTAASVLMGRGMRLPAVRDDIVRLLNTRATSEDAGGAVTDVQVAGPILFVPSPVVHIMHSRREPAFRTTPLEWTMLGYTLPRAIAAAWHVDENRIDVPATFGDARFDIIVRLPREERRETIEALVRHAIEDQFDVTVTLETHGTDVFLVTAPGGPGPGLRQRAEPQGAGAAAAFVSFSTSVPHQQSTPMFPIDRLSLSDMPLPILCTTLTEILGLPVVDQTGLRGVFDLELQRPIADREELRAVLRDEAGLVLTIEHRQIDRLIVRPR